MDNDAIERIAAQRRALMPDQTTPLVPVTTGGEAAGYALAQSAIIKAKTTGWLYYVAKLIGLEVEGRAAFVKYIGQENRALGKTVKAMKGQPDEVIYKRARASSMTRLSELVQIARALNGGMEIAIVRDPQTGAPAINAAGDVVVVDPFYTIVAEARTFVQSNAQGRGRPPKPFLDKLKAFMEKEAKSRKEWEQAEEFTKAHLSAAQHRAAAKKAKADKEAAATATA